MNDRQLIRIRPIRGQFKEKKFAMGTDCTAILTLEFQNNFVLVGEGSKSEKFFIKKFATNRTPTPKEFHIRTDGLSLYLSPNDMYLLDMFDQKINLLKSGSSSSSINIQSTSFQNQRHISPSLRPKSEALTITSGVVSRNKRDHTTTRIESPSRVGVITERKIYTQSPLKSPLKDLAPSIEKRPLTQQSQISSTLNQSNEKLNLNGNLVTYGRKRPYSSIDKPIPSFSVEESQSTLDVVAEIPAGYNQPLPTSISTSPLTGSDTKAMSSHTQNMFSKRNSNVSVVNNITSSSSSSSSSSLAPPSLWDTLSSQITPFNASASYGKQARMRLSSSSTIEEVIADGVRTPVKRSREVADDPSISITPIFSRPPLLGPFAMTSVISSTSKSFSKSATKFDGTFEGGIRNLGNTCYMSSILQALSSVRGLSYNLHSPLWVTMFEQLTCRPTSTVSKENEQMENKDVTKEVVLTSPPLSEKYSLSLRKPFLSPDKSIFMQLTNMLRLLETKRNRAINQEELKVLLGPSGLGNSIFDSNFNSKIDSILKIERKYCVDPARFRSCIIGQQDKYANYSQQDAQEFVTDLMNDLEDDMLKAIRTFWMYQKMTSFLENRTLKDSVWKLPVATPSPAAITQVPATIGQLSTHDGDTAVTNIDDSDFMHVVSEENEPKEVSELQENSIDQQSMRRFQEEIEEHIPALKALLPPSLFLESTMQSIMTCVSCGHRHEPRFEPYRDFSLDVLPPEDCDTLLSSPRQRDLHHLIRRYLQPDSLELRCSHCEHGRNVTLQKQIVSVAPVLVFHLKRFQYDRTTYQFRKVDSTVTFPAKLSLRSAGMINDQTPWNTFESKYQMTQTTSFKRIFENKDVDSAQSVVEKWESCDRIVKDMRGGKISKGMMAFARPDDSEYQLIAVVRHYGTSIGGGHYICDVRNHKGGSDNDSKWLRYNDSIVNTISEESVLAEGDTPYLLFYQRQQL